MSDKDDTKLVRSEVEIREMLLRLMMSATYMVIALSPDIELQLKDLFNLATLDPKILGTSYFGRTDN